jgi:hypothetical protein
MSAPKDMKGFAFNVGCKVARATMWGKSPMLSICEVTDIKDGRIYLDSSKQPMKFPERLLIIEQDPLYRMVKTYDNEKND